jgi:hypothetical protein
MESFRVYAGERGARVGKSRSRWPTREVLALPDPVHALLREGRLSAGHAKVFGRNYER